MGVRGGGEGGDEGILLERLEEAERGQWQRAGADEGYPAWRGLGRGQDGAELEAGELLVVFIVGEGLEAGQDLVWAAIGGEDVLGPVQLEAGLGLGADLAQRGEDC